MTGASFAATRWLAMTMASMPEPMSDGFRFAPPILRTVLDLRQHLDAAERGDAAALEHHDLRRQLTQFGGVMADIDHRNALVAQPHQIGQDFLLAALIERSQRLVEQQQARL